MGRSDLKAMLASTTMPAFLPVVKRKPWLEFEMEIANVDPDVFDLLFYGGENPCIVRGEN